MGIFTEPEQIGGIFRTKVKWGTVITTIIGVLIVIAAMGA